MNEFIQSEISNLKRTNHAGEANYLLNIYSVLAKMNGNARSFTAIPKVAVATIGNGLIKKLQS